MSETLLHEIRATKPEAPSALRERVRALSVQEPVREPFLDRIRFTWGWRRLVLAVPATAVVALVAAGVIGLSRDGAGRDQATSAGSAAELQPFDTATAPPNAGAPVLRAAAPAAKDAATGSTIAPAPGQLQRFEAELGLRVDDVNALSDATKQAQQIARDHGGSVASLQYDAPSAGVGTAQITLHIPTAQVEGALAELSQLGTIVGQRYGIQDLQQQADGLQTQIEQTQRRIAQILTQLESATLSNENRVVLQSRLNAARLKLTGLRESLRSTRAEAATSTVNVTLTTEEIEAVPVGGSRLDGIKDVLAWEAIAVLYALVVAGPFILLGLLVWLALRLRRRQVETRLLEQN
jgi:Domain of unknown function (DUF4349)